MFEKQATGRSCNPFPSLKNSFHRLCNRFQTLISMNITYLGYKFIAWLCIKCKNVYFGSETWYWYLHVQQFTKFCTKSFETFLCYCPLTSLYKKNLTLIYLQWCYISFLNCYLGFDFCFILLYL